MFDTKYEFNFNSAELMRLSLSILWQGGMLFISFKRNVKTALGFASIKPLIISYINYIIKFSVDIFEYFEYKRLQALLNYQVIQR